MATKSSADYNSEQLSNYNLLFKAVVSGSDTAINHLLDMNMNQLQTLLRIAATHNSNAHLLQLSKVLLQRGAVVDSSILIKADVELLEILLEFGECKIQVKAEDWCKLCRSAIDGNAKKLFLLLINKCDWVIQTKDTDFGVQNLLFIAVERDWQEAVSKLLDLGANPNFTSSQKKQSPLYIAASKKLLLICKLLVSRGAVLNSSNHEQDPMVQAVINGSVDAAETLLSLGSRCKCNERLVLALVKKDEYESPGRNVPCPQKITNGTLLHYAVTLGNLPIVEFMINRCHANIETTDSHGNTALLLAANRLSPDIVEFLLKTCQEKRLNTLSYMGQKTTNRSTALYHAINAVKAVDSSFLERAELKIIESFVKRNVDLRNECNLTHVRALIVAIRCNQGGLIRDLIRCGLPKQMLNESCIYESLPLQEAMEADSWTCVETLIKLGASIPGEPGLGGVPFPHYVIENCVSKEDILQVFNALDWRVDWNAVSRPRTSFTSVNYSNGTVLHAAIRKNCDVDVIKYCLAKCVQSINVAIDSEEENGILKLAYQYINGGDKKLTVCEMLVQAGARLPSSVLNNFFPKKNYAERKIAEMLIVAGCDIRVRQECLQKAMASKHWFLSKMLLHTAGRSCVSSLSHLAESTQWPDNMQLESQMLAHPSSYVSSLSALARQVIRQQLRYHTAGCSIIPASFRLPLPRLLQQYILLADISRCTINSDLPHRCSFPDTCDNSIEQEDVIHINYSSNAAMLLPFYFNTHVYDSDNDDNWHDESYYDGNYWDEYRSWTSNNS